MSYQALARQYRPQNFTELVGQEHVSQALINGLEQDRIHHAFLFTGTRGVGKTTVARILAKALNCEKGVTGSPCGVCGACTEISEGRFVDLIEVDAASRTGVDDTRELLENVQYAPTKGRYKIYLIDEVHMFSNSSFNALLKTLEEPPPHVKFLLATTEPKKLPVTVLSRCLQFNLKRLNLSQIKNHLVKLLNLQEAQFDDHALELIARAADGSMRDGLSLLDQSLAFGAGKVLEKDVKLMLGTMDQDKVVGLLNSILDKDSAGLCEKLEQIFVMSPDYSRFLNELALLLHEVSLFQILNKAVDGSPFERSTIIELVNKTTPEQIQLFYQIVIKGQEEINLAPDSKTGFEMTVIRLFAFKIGNPTENSNAPVPTSKSSPKQTTNQQANVQQNSASQQNSNVNSNSNMAQQNNQTNSVEQNNVQNIVPSVEFDSAERVEKAAEISAVKPVETVQNKYSLADISNDNWNDIYASLPIKAMSKVLAKNAHVISNQDDVLVLGIDKQAESFMTESAQSKLCKALQDLVTENIEVKLENGYQLEKTIARTEQNIEDAHIRDTKQQVNQNPFVQHMQENFDAQVIQIKQGQNFLEV